MGEAGYQHVRETLKRRETIYPLIDLERARQENLKTDGKFLYTCADAGMLSGEKFLVLAEEVGEVARVILNMRLFSTDYKADLEVLREELVQVAAVSVAWLEFIQGLIEVRNPAGNSPTNGEETGQEH